MTASATAAAETINGAARVEQQPCLAEAVRSGVAWTTAMNVLADVSQFAVTIVLARLLEPAAYGQFALVTAVITWLSVLSFRSFVEYAVHEPSGKQVDFSSYFVAGGLLQAALFAVVLALAAGLSRIAGYRAAAPALAAMAAFFLLDWASELRVKMLERALDWPRLNRLRAAGMGINVVSAIALALAGAGVYALLLPGLLALLPFIWDLFVVAGWRPRARVDWAGLRPALRFGAARVGSGLAFTSRQLVESGALAGSSGFTAAGFYGRATGLANLACARVPSVLTLMLRPVLARVGEAERYGHVAGLVLRCVVWVVTPAFALGMMLGEPLIGLVYGARWLAALDLLPWALAASAGAALVQTGNVLLLGRARPRQCLWADAMVLCGCLAGTLLLVSGRPRWYLGAVALTQLVVFGAQLRWLHREGALAWRHGVATLGPCAVAVAGALLVAVPVDELAAQWPAVVRVLACGVSFGVVYLLLLRVLSAAELREVVAYCPGRRYLERVL